MHELDDKSTPRRRGRPKGSRGQVERAVGLRLHDFAFMRAVAQGVAPDAAAERYMPDGQTDVRTAKALYRRLIAEVVAQLDGFADVAVASQAAAARLALQLDDEGVSTPRAPSLDDFAAEFDADGFSERELLEMYQERYGSALEAAESVEARVRALNWLQPRLARVPGPADPVTAWLGASVSTALRGAGVLRLEELLALLRVRGRSWYRRVPSIGRDRARRIEAWLSMHEEQLGAIVWPAAHLAAAAATLPSMYGAIS
ncbi:MAG: hypothetical protein KA795_05940, partial [Burkholderiaceae bacterium]|nr:hypothetical protein [Burkholderiaceae bacterium]